MNDRLPEHAADRAYAAIAPIYDELTGANNYEMWLGEKLLPELAKHGLETGRVLDVGCGTGRAFEPMLSRGWELFGCDLTAAMLAQARRKFGDRIPLEVADARALPRFGEFELVWALSDVVNYLVEDGDLELALVGMRKNLARGGLILFDANSFGSFESNFAAAEVEEMSVDEWRWIGQADRVEPGGTFPALVHGRGIGPQLHLQRHYPEEDVRASLKAARLECLAALGQREVGDGQVVLTESPDELRDHKIVYIARAADEAAPGLG
jgi:SAM-dependent methyltransferase